MDETPHRLRCASPNAEQAWIEWTSWERVQCMRMHMYGIVGVGASWLAGWLAGWLAS